MNARTLRRLCCIASLTSSWLAGGWSASPARAGWAVDGSPVCSEAHNQSPYSIVSDGAQGAIVVWSDNRNTGLDIYAQRVNSSGDVLWSTNGVSVCSQAADQSDGFALAAPGNGAIVFWVDNRNLAQDIYAQRISGSGLQVWTTDGIPLGATSDGKRFPRAISDGSH